MNELTKPLGQKPEPTKKPKNEKKSISTFSIATFILAASAFGFVLYDQFYATNDTASKSGSTVEFENEKPVLRNTTIELAKPKPEAPPLERLQPIEPEVSLVVPRPKPKVLPRTTGQKTNPSYRPEKALSEKGATGIIPKISSDGRRAMDVYAREPDTTGNFGVARVVLIVASMGISQSSSQQAIRELPDSVTLAFAPYGNSLTRWMEQARKKGHELLLQLPMEPFSQANPGPHTLTTDAGSAENLANLHWSLSRITNYVGVMNYLGAKISGDDIALKPIFDDLADRGLLYVDDGSAGKSRTEIAAARSVLPYTKAHIQIDATRTRAHISAKLKELSTKAKRTGLAIGVANAYPETIKMLSNFAREAGRNGIEITPVSAIVNDPTR